MNSLIDLVEKIRVRSNKLLSLIIEGKHLGNRGTDYSFLFSIPPCVFFFGLRPAFLGARMRPSSDSNRLTNSDEPHGRPVRVRIRSILTPDSSSSG